jgi:Fibronectin type III domain
MRRLILAVLVAIAAPVSAEAQNCSYALSTLTVNIPAAGGTGTVRVTTGATCNWTASSDRSWLTVQNPTGTGTANVTWVATANTLATQRIGFLTIGGISVWVTQFQSSTPPLPPPPTPPPPTPPPPTPPPPTPPPPTAAPGAPRQLAATVNGTSLTLTWSAPDTGGAPSTYVLAAGTSAGWSNLGSFSTGGTATSFTASNLPLGLYFARVSAQNATGISPASNEVSFTVPQACTSTPGAPADLQSSVSGSVVTLTWGPPAGGAAPTAYQIEAGSGPSLADLARITVGATPTTFSANASPGTYYVRVRALTACGASAPSPEVGILVR